MKLIMRSHRLHAIGGVAILSMVVFSKLSRGHFGIITLLLLQWSVSIVTGGLLLPTVIRLVSTVTGGFLLPPIMRLVAVVTNGFLLPPIDVCILIGD